MTDTQEKQEYQGDTLPGSTPETSEQLQKAEKGEASGGKSPLKFDPNAPAAEMVVRPRDMLVEGEVDESKTPQQQIHPMLRGVIGDDWQNYANDAIRALYPHMREGVDYQWGSRDPDSPPEMLFWDDKKFAAPDMGKIEELATKNRNRDPYRAGAYQPRPGLHAGSERGPGEQPTSDTLKQDPRTAGMSPTGGQPTDPELREQYEEGPADQEQQRDNRRVEGEQR